MPGREGLAREWLGKGRDDFTTAKLAFGAGAPPGTTGVLLQQALEKHLKGYLISKGWRLKKTHDLVELIEVAAHYDSAFREYVGLADRLTAHYLEERYPSSSLTEYSREEIGAFLEQTEKAIIFIEGATG